MSIRLSQYIRDNMEPILQRWENFAKSIESAEYLDKNDLRDHAERMLLVIAEDIEAPRPLPGPASKSYTHGVSPDEPGLPSILHGRERQEVGLSMPEVFSEFRALRESVLSYWTEAYPKLSGTKIEDLMRFNQAIDQAIAESLKAHSLAEKEIRHNAFHDHLTGLPNRRLFLNRLDQEIKHAKRSATPIAVFFMDLDGFKKVNDSLGHEAGDHLLCAVAERINGCVRAGDTVARIGGDEFGLILTGMEQLRDAEQVAQSIIDALSLPFEIEQRSSCVSGSIGIALCFRDGVSPAELLRAADRAMYTAKRSESGTCYASSRTENSLTN